MNNSLRCLIACVLMSGLWSALSLHGEDLLLRDEMTQAYADYTKMTRQEALDRFLKLYQESIKRHEPDIAYNLATRIGHEMNNLKRPEDALKYYLLAIEHSRQSKQKNLERAQTNGDEVAIKTYSKIINSGVIDSVASSNAQGQYISMGFIAKAQALFRETRDGFVRLELDKAGLSIEGRDLSKLPIVSSKRVPDSLLASKEILYLSMAGQTREALKIAHTVVHVMRKIPDRNGQLNASFYSALNHEASLLEDMGDLSGALALRKEMMSYPVSAYGNITWHTNVMKHLRLNEQLNEADEALWAEAQKSLTKMENWKDLDARQIAWMELSKIMSMRGQFAQAEDYLDKAEKLADETGERVRLTQIALQRMELTLAQGKIAALSASQFDTLLVQMRAFGLKDREPDVYRLYAQYLKQCGDMDGALAMQEAYLELLKNFDWTYKIPEALAFKASLLEASKKSYAATIAKQQHAAMTQHLKSNPHAAELADVQGVSGKGKSTQAILRASLPPSASEAADREGASVILQPKAMCSVVAADEFCGGRFTLSSIVDTPCAGTLSLDCDTLSLKQARWDEAAGTLFITAAEMVEKPLRFEQSMALQGREQVVIYLESQWTRQEPMSLTAKWAVPGKPLQEATWQFQNGKDTQIVSVVNASLEKRSPFLPASLYHEFYHRGAAPVLQNIRLQTNIPCRIEVLDESSRALLAVDENGNGDFSDAGDQLSADKDRDGRLDIAFNQDGISSIEVLLFIPEQVKDAVELSVQLWKNGHWETQAIDKILP